MGGPRRAEQKTRNARLAQLAVQLLCKHQVRGSRPWAGTKLNFTSRRKDMSHYLCYLRWRNAQYLQARCLERFGPGSAEVHRAYLVAEHWRADVEEKKPETLPPEILEAKLWEAEKAVERDRPEGWEPEEWKG